MLELREGTPVDMLQQFSVDLRADLIEGLGASRLVLDNEHGKGRISLYEVFTGMTAWVYNIRFSEEYTIDVKFSDKPLFYFGYHVSGHQMTRFPDESESKKVGERQNFILTGESGTKCEFIIPANTKYECCYLIIEPDLLDQPNTKTKEQLRKHLSGIFGRIGTEKMYRYFGNIDIRTGVYADAIVKNRRTDLVGRLLTEAAIMNMLASQIESHNHDLKAESQLPEISKIELSGIARLGDYIQENIGEKHSVKDLSREIGLSERKLQDGVQFLFGHSVNQYVINIRLERAMELFTESDKNVSEICYEVGYNSRSHFSKQFKERYGILPSKYKSSLNMEDLFFEISYRSMGIEGLPDEQIERILKTSRGQNNLNDITGCLIYYRNVFFQLIEGPKKKVLALYEKIEEDNRHYDVQLIWRGLKPERDFQEWDMALMSDEGELKLPHEGSTNSLNLDHLMGEINEQSLESKYLWRKVRNLLKVNSKSEESSNSN